MLVGVALTLAIAAIGRGELGGRIELVGADGKVTPAAGAIVWLPRVPVSDAPARPAVASKAKRFEPHVLAVPRGATVAFPNVDPIFHNVFSVTPGNAFDLGLYRKGAVKEIRFEQTGLVRLFCNIHSDMAAYVMVLDAAFTVTDTTGRYRMAGLPEGRLEVRVWHERAGETSATVEAAPGRAASLDLRLDASKHKDAPHKNKYGEDYPPATHDADRY